MTSLRELLADNLKENRRKLGLSQAKLAEKSGVSTQYIAMIELCRKFPSPEKLEKLAQALEVDTPELFSMPASVKEATIKLHRTILAELDQKLGEKITIAAKAAVSELVSAHLRDMDEREQTIQKNEKPHSRSDGGRRR